MLLSCLVILRLGLYGQLRGTSLFRDECSNVYRIIERAFFLFPKSFGKIIIGIEFPIDMLHDF